MGFSYPEFQEKSSDCLVIMWHFSILQYLVLHYEKYPIFSQNSFYPNESVCIHISHVNVARNINEGTC